MCSEEDLFSGDSWNGNITYPNDGVTRQTCNINPTSNTYSTLWENAFYSITVPFSDINTRITVIYNGVNLGTNNFPITLTNPQQEKLVINITGNSIANYRANIIVRNINN